MIYILGIITGILLSLIMAVVSLYATRRGNGINRIESMLNEKATVYIPPQPGSYEEKLFDMLHEDSS